MSLIKISDCLICSQEFINEINLIQIAEYEYDLSEDKKILKYGIQLSNIVSQKKRDHLVYGKEYTDNNEAKLEMDRISQKINQFNNKSLINVESHFWYDQNLIIKSIHITHYLGNFPQPPQSYIIVISFSLINYTCWASGKQFSFDEAKRICNTIHENINSLKETSSTNIS